MRALFYIAIAVTLLWALITLTTRDWEIPLLFTIISALLTWVYYYKLQLDRLREENERLKDKDRFLNRP